jgi:hypothetical protein
VTRRSASGLVDRLLGYLLEKRRGLADVQVIVGMFVNGIVRHADIDSGAAFGRTGRCAAGTLRRAIANCCRAIDSRPPVASSTCRSGRCVAVEISIRDHGVYS